MMIQKRKTIFLVTVLVALFVHIAAVQAAPPTVTTLPVSGITTTNATLNGSVNPNGFTTTAYFEYGLTTNYGNIGSFTPLPATNVNVTMPSLLVSAITGPAGTNWIRQTNSPDASWSDVALSADGMRMAAVVEDGGIYTSMDGGKHWTQQVNAPTQTWESIASSADGSKLVAVASATTNYAYTSTDFGTNWTVRPGPPGYNFHTTDVASSADGTQLVSVDGNGSYISTNSGSTWVERSVSNEVLSGVACSADGSKIVVTTGSGTIYISTNVGLTWALSFQYFVSPVISSVASSADGTTLAEAIYGNFIILSTNSGTAWSPPSLPGGYYNWRSISCSADGTRMSAVEVGGQIWTSINSGENWYPSGLSKNWWSIDCSVDATRLAAVVTAGDGIYTSTGQSSALTPGTTYHYRRVAINSSGTTLGSDETFTTAVPMPTVTTLPATGVSNTVGTLKGSVNPNGVSAAGWFERGQTVGWYDQQSPHVAVGSGVANIPLSYLNTGLTLGNVFHYRAAASNSYGIVYGKDAAIGSPNVELAGDDPIFLLVDTPFVDPGASANDFILDIAAGDSHGLAIRADRTVATWGNTNYGLANIPAGATSVVAVSAGIDHSIALRSDGSIVTWGSDAAISNAPTGETDFTGIAAGGHFGLALRTDGTVAAWGSNSHGQTNIPEIVMNATVIAVAAGGYHSMALLSDHTVNVWGRSDVNQTNVPPTATNVIAIAAGDRHCIALRDDGQVIAWGYNNSGQLFVPPGALSNVVAIAAGAFHNLALRSDGTIIGWGRNTESQSTIPAGASSSVAAVAAGFQYSAALRQDGTVIAWGDNTSGQTNTAGLNASLAVSVSGSVNAGVIDSYILTYITTNALGGVGTVTRTVSVVSVLPPVTYYVRTNGSDAASGKSWLNAKQTIQAAVDLTVDGDSVIVSNGTYATGGRTYTGGMTNRVIVTNNITLRSLNGPAFTTILGAKDPLTTNGSAAIRCVYIVSNATMVGFTLSGGATRAVPVFPATDRDATGGGLYCDPPYLVEIVISNCVITGNSASENAGGVYGGSLYNCVLADNHHAFRGGGASASRLVDCLVISNSAVNGGAGSFCNFTRCDLLDNTAEGNGGGAEYGVLTNCTLSGNAGGYGGGAHSATIFNSSVVSNQSTVGQGGGVNSCTVYDSLISGNTNVQGGAGAYASTLSYCTVSYNVASYSGGGAQYGQLINCVVFENVAGGNGGGVLQARLVGCAVVKNSAGFAGGGVANSDLANCLLLDNTATNAYVFGVVGGGGAYLSRLTNCTIVGNAATLGGGSLSNAHYNCILYANTADVGPDYEGGTFHHSRAYPLPAGSGNFTNDPQFVDAGSDNFHLFATSPCRDTGDNEYAPPGLDPDGNPRIVNGYVDLGLFEYQGSPQGDYDGDGNGNGDEGVAGTDFANSNDVFEVSGVTVMSPTSISFDSVIGRVYAVDYNDALIPNPQIWTEFTNNIAGTGSPLSIMDPDDATNRNYRVRVRMAP